MVSKEYVEKQLRGLNFNINGWGRAEVNELCHIILPDEKIFECVNGIYEGGFALLLATDIRVLLVDKKMLNFLTVEDLRFDMINELDYSHRVLGAFITIATGNKTLIFRSYNKLRLRKLIGHVQHCMAESKKQQTFHQEGQNQNLEKINQQLQAYLVAQYKQQQKMQQQLEKAQQNNEQVNVPKLAQPNNKLADYLYARGLIKEYQDRTGQELSADPITSNANPVPTSIQVADEPVFPWTEPPKPISQQSMDSQLDEIYAEGLKEVFGSNQSVSKQLQSRSTLSTDSTNEINPLKVAYSKLPMVLSGRRFRLKRASFPANPQYKARPESLG